MRISDWSSDVCSSDLSTALQIARDRRPLWAVPCAVTAQQWSGPMLEIRGLEKRFGTVAAVDRVSLAIPDGQMVGVIGRSGAGKSTLLRLLNRLAEPTGGQILFDGDDVSILKGRALMAWRARCAMIFQQFNLVGRLAVLPK